MGQLGRTQKSQAASEKKLKAYACELEQKLEARTRELAEARGHLSESLQQQTATADVLKVISRSVSELQPVLDTLVVSAARLCNAEMAFIFRREGNAFRATANFGFPPEFDAFVRTLVITPNRRTITGRVVLEGKPVQIADITADPEYEIPETNRLGKARTLVGVPLLRDNVPIGVICVARQRVEPFTDKQIGLVTIFADQAVIAIENVRLFDEVQARTRELSEALEQQIATAEILHLISSSPTDVQPVLEAMVASSARLCEALDATILLRDGDIVVPRAHSGPIGVVVGERQPLNRDWVTGRAVLEARTVHVPDLLHSDEYPVGRELARRRGHRATLAV